MPKGRPSSSEIRQNIIDILYFLKKGYGYEIYKIYTDLFPKVTMRSVYYHLKYGLKSEEFRIEKIEKEKGDYSWGSEAEKIYYSLDKNANPRVNEKIKGYLEKKNLL